MARNKAIKKAIARQLSKAGWEPFVELDRRTCSAEQRASWPAQCQRAFYNNIYTVLVQTDYPTSIGPATKALVVPLHGGRDVFWKDLQRIKNEIFGEEAVAVQYYPAESELIDEKNIYWLFLYPNGELPIPQTTKTRFGFTISGNENGLQVRV